MEVQVRRTECPPGAYFLTINSLNSNQELDTLIRTAKPLNPGASIKSSTKTWYTGSSIILDRAGNHCCSSMYSWLNIGTTEKYIGLKLNKGASTYYGWVRIVVSAGIGASFTIKDYAYNSNSNQTILAGQTQ